MQIRTDHHHKLIFHGDEMEWIFLKNTTRKENVFNGEQKLNLCKFSSTALSNCYHHYHRPRLSPALCKGAIELELFDGAYQLHNNSHDAFLRFPCTSLLQPQNFVDFALELNISSEFFLFQFCTLAIDFGARCMHTKNKSGSWIIWVTISVTRLRTLLAF